MSIINRFATKEPTLCGVCRRRAWWIGYSPRQGAKIMWMCDDANCIKSGKDVYTMPTSRLDAYERNALMAGGAAGGQYLDEIGQTDLANLTEGEFGEFLRRVLTGYEKNLREKILSGEAPF